MYPELTIYYYKLGVDLSYSGPPVGPNPPKKKSVESLGGEGFNMRLDKDSEFPFPFSATYAKTWHICS